MRSKTFQSSFWEVPRIIITNISGKQRIDWSTHFCYYKLTSLCWHLHIILRFDKDFFNDEDVNSDHVNSVCSLLVRITSFINGNSAMTISFHLVSHLVLDQTVLSSNIQETTSSGITMVILLRPCLQTTLLVHFKQFQS